MTFKGFIFNDYHFNWLCGLSPVVSIQACLAFLGLGATRQSLGWSWWSCTISWSRRKRAYRHCLPRCPPPWRLSTRWTLMTFGLSRTWLQSAIFLEVEPMWPFHQASLATYPRNFKKVSGGWAVAVRSRKLWDETSFKSVQNTILEIFTHNLGVTRNHRNHPINWP